MRANTAERFWAKVDQTESDGCWPWTRAQDQCGYGMFWLGGRSHRAHRIAYELSVAPIPDGLVLDHLCRNRLCVNPDHLEPVTDRVNILRGEGVAALHASKTHCPQGHAYAGANLIQGELRRACRECTRSRGRDYMRRKRAAS